MKKTISQDLKSISELVQHHHKQLGLDPVKALEETQKLVENIGRSFNGDSLYISFNENLQEKELAVKKEMDKGCYSAPKISRITGIPRASVYRLMNKIKHSDKK